MSEIDWRSMFKDVLNRMRVAGESNEMGARWMASEASSAVCAVLAAKDAELERLTVVIEKYREAQQAEWQPISTCPFRDPVDLWCVYGGEEFAQFDGGASIGRLISGRFKTVEYGFFGNQSNDGVPQRDAPDLVPVAWRRAVPSCPPKLIAEALGIPLTREDAIAVLSKQEGTDG